MLERFRADYARRYGAGSMMLGAPVELVTLRAVGVGATVKPAVTSGRRPAVAAGTSAAPVAERRVRVGRDADGWDVVGVYDGSDLCPGHTLTGPALVDERDTTVWIPAGAVAAVDDSGTITIQGAARAVPAPAADRPGRDRCTGRRAARR